MIKFFISSTFIDMIDEREVIHSRIYPLMREYGLKRGINVDICDLRWGIYIDRNWDEEKLTKEIMNVCFGELEDCKPYLITIIGNRYGYVPKDNSAIKELWTDYIKSPLPEELNISLTQWEIEFSLLSRSRDDIRALCLFKEKTGEETDEKAYLLRKRIENKSKKLKNKVLCFDYSGIDKFCEILESNIKKIIDEEVDVFDKNWVDLEIEFTRAYCLEKKNLFRGRKKLLEQCIETINDDSNRVLELCGKSGIGKSFLISRIIYEIRRSGDKKCEAIFCGTSKASSDYIKVMSQIIYILELEMNLIKSSDKPEVHDEFYSEEEGEKTLRETIEEYNKKIETKKFILFIDAIEKLDDKKIKKIINIFKLTEGTKVSLVCSSIYDKVDDSEFVKKIDINLLNKEEIKGILKQRLFDARQEIGDDNELIIEIMKKYNCRYPLYLEFVTNVLKTHLRETNGEIIKIKELLETIPDDLGKLCWYSIEEAINYLYINSGVNKNNMLQIIGLIAESRHGLLESDLQSLIGEKWRSVDFANIRNYLANYFRQQGNGCWSFEHDIIKDSIRKNFSFRILEENFVYNVIKKMQDKLYKFVKYSDSLEINIREGLYLSVIKNDLIMSKNIFEMIKNADISMRRLAAGEILNLTETAEGETWYKNLIEKYRFNVVDLLVKLLEYISDEDYNRRIPAKKLTDIFFEINADLINKLEDDNRDDKLFRLALLYEEYINVCECVGQEFQHADSIEFPVQYFDTMMHSDIDIDEEKRILLYKKNNNLLYINNKIMVARYRNIKKSIGEIDINTFNDSKHISETIINGFMKDNYGFNKKYGEVLDKENSKSKMLRAVYEKYISNIGQYYNGVGDYNSALQYHFKSLLIKTESLLKLYFDDGEELFTEFRNKFDTELIESNNFTERMWEQVDFDSQFKFWKKLCSIIINTENDYKIVDKIKAAGVSYRTIATDCYYIDTKESLRFGCKCMDVAYNILSDKRISQKEQLATLVRKIGIYIKNKEDIRQEDILKWCEKAKVDYLNNKEYFGEKIKSDLLCNMIKFKEWLEVNKAETSINRLNQI